jgi:thioredoxin reductase (NADPH)
MSERYDIAIIGSGPAGLSAALNAKIRKKKFMIFGNSELTPKLSKAHEINNYLGFYRKSGKDIQEEFNNHLKEMDINITEEKINNVYAMGDYFALMVNEKMYEATTVILATGVQYGKLFTGEERLLGKGVGYCATCDAPLYKGKVVTIVSYNKHEEAEANFISTIASKVYYIPMYDEEVEVDCSIEIIKDTPIEIIGEDKVSKLKLKNSEIETDGIFILRDSISPGQLVPGLNIVDNHIEVDRLMKTNINGCFAAGDIVGKPYQYIKAAGEGNIAALSAVGYIDSISKK